MYIVVMPNAERCIARKNLEEGSKLIYMEWENPHFPQFLLGGGHAQKQTLFFGGMGG